MDDIFKTPQGTVLPLLILKGKPYLQVAHRLVWFREEKPSWSIQTQPVKLEKDLSVFKATILDESGRVIATAHKSETPQGFSDHMEKSETGAIGRALAMCGFGTQFCTDDFEESKRLVDSPVTPVATPKFKPDTGPACPLCNAPMGTSKFNPDEWFCFKCRKGKLPKNNDYSPQDDLPL